MRYTQPQSGPLRLATSNPLTRGAQAVFVASSDVNVATGKALTRTGSGYLKSTVTAGVATSFRENFYLSTEVLPAIGTAPFVEIWVGYPTAKVGPKAATNEAKFLTGSSSNQIGIFQNNKTGASGWGGLHAWSTSLNTSSDVLAAGKYTVLVAVRRSTGMELWRDGVLIQTFTQSPTSLTAQKMVIGAFVEEISYWSVSSDTVLAARIKAEWNANDVKSFSANPYQIFEAPQPIYLYKAASGGAGSVTGAANITLAGLVCGATATGAVSAASNTSLGGLAVSGAGTVAAPARSAAASITLSALSASASVGVRTNAASSATLGSIGVAALATTSGAATSSTTLGGIQTVGAASSPVTAIGAVTLGALTLTSAGGSEATPARVASAAIHMGELGTVAAASGVIAATSAKQFQALGVSSNAATQNTGRAAILFGGMVASAAGYIGENEPIIFSRAPSGPGYTPAASNNTTRPQQVTQSRPAMNNSARPASTQRNTR